MNYIHTLQAEVERLKQERAAALAALNELQVYMASSKFHVDTTIQVGDVNRRLEPVRVNLLGN